jgi:mannose-6-phosphate isomerase-like protein (cupin superfamily)
MNIINRAQAEPFTTKDGSQIRELLAYRNSVIRNQSLAEATIAVGTATQEHYHPKSEEIYYILSGAGRMKLEDELRNIGPLDAIAIPPGARHKIWNTGHVPLVLLCCCAPAYENDDTVMAE